MYKRRKITQGSGFKFIRRKQIEKVMVSEKSKTNNSLLTTTFNTVITVTDLTLLHQGLYIWIARFQCNAFRRDLIKLDQLKMVFKTVNSASQLQNTSCRSIYLISNRMQACHPCL